MYEIEIPISDILEAAYQTLEGKLSADDIQRLLDHAEPLLASLVTTRDAAQ